MNSTKFLTSAVTAIALVGGIGLAVAQSEDQPAQLEKAQATQPSDMNAQANPPADPTAPAADPAVVQPTSAPNMQPADAASAAPRTDATPPAYSATPLPSDDTATNAANNAAMNGNTATTPTTPMPDQSSTPSYTEPAPKPDRN
jgi:hypothetical protein